MVERKPLYVDTSGTNTYRWMQSGDTVPVSNLPIASGSTAGSMSAAHYTRVEGSEDGATADQTAKRSVEIDADEIQLVGDVDSPGADQVYGTNGSGVRVWKADPVGGGGTGNTTSPGTHADEDLAVFDGIDSQTLKVITTGGMLTKLGVEAGSIAPPFTGSNIASTTITAANIAPNTIGASEIASGGVTEDELGVGSVTNTKIGGAAVTGPKIDADAVDSSHIQTDAVGSDQIAPDSVGTSELVAGSADNTILADMAQDTIKGRITASTGDPEDLTPTQVRTMINVADNAQPGNATNVGGIGGASLVKQVLADGTVEVWKLQAGDTSSTVIVSFDAVDGYKFAVGPDSLTAGEIANNAVGNQELADMTANTIKGREDTTGNPQDLVPGRAHKILGPRGSQTYVGMQFDPLRPVQTLRLKNIAWEAGAAAAAPSHANGDLYPYMVFTAIDTNGYPHTQHNDLGKADQNSNYEGYTDGLQVAKGVLNWGDTIVFECSGFMENTTRSDAFVEFVLDPTPTLDDYTDTDIMRMSTGALEATWADEKPFHFRAEFRLGSSIEQDDYVVDWSMDIQDVERFSGVIRETAGKSFKHTDTALSLRYRVDEITNVVTYDDTYQDDGIKLTINEYHAGLMR